MPNVQVVESIGGETLIPQGEELPITSNYLDVVRGVMDGVVHKDGGSAYQKGLSEADIGFRFVCKTGSADYITSGQIPDWDNWNRHSGKPPIFTEGVRKHTWVAGWLPADDPKLIMIIYIHDTATTSSHGAVYVAGQMLRHPAVQSFLREQE